MQENDVTFRFETPVLLFGAAPVTAEVTARLTPLSALPVLAADGGVRTALALGLVPQAVIGDMDSLGVRDDLPASIRQMPMVGQYDTDFEKCMNSIRAPLVIGVGFLDGRVDHTLAVLNVLARQPRPRRVLLLGAHDVMLRLGGDFSVSLAPRTRLSVWPLWRQDFVRSLGLEWPLDGIDMAAGARTGTSNRVTDGAVSVETGDGDGYCLIAPLESFDALYAAARVER